MGTFLEICNQSILHQKEIGNHSRPKMNQNTDLVLKSPLKKNLEPNDCTVEFNEIAKEITPISLVFQKH